MILNKHLIDLKIKNQPKSKSLQNFTVLPTDIFRRYEIQSLSVIFLPTKSPTENVRRHNVRR
jgi:hypothetical protein